MTTSGRTMVANAINGVIRVAGPAIKNGDGVELYLSTYPEQYNTGRGTSYNSTYDYHLVIGYSDVPQGYMISHNQALTGAVIAKLDTSDGYIVEAKIPWSNFGSPQLTPMALAAGFVEYRQLGINVALNDADTSATTVDHKLLWGNATDSDIETNPIKLEMSFVDPAGGLYVSPTYTLTTSASNGNVTKSPDLGSYQANSVVTLTAVANPEYVFTGWSQDASGTTNPISITMDGNKTITANFQLEGILTSIVVTLASGSVRTSQTLPFSAIGYDQNGAVLSPQPTFSWTVNGGGVGEHKWGVYRRDHRR
jgi:uncharacterized repeat protein (TIGR02543 family)